jgi:hypothetical protein
LAIVAPHRLGHVGRRDRHQLARLQDRDHLDDGQRARLLQARQIDEHRRVQEHVRELGDLHAQLAIDHLECPSCAGAARSAAPSSP